MEAIGTNLNIKGVQIRFDDLRKSGFEALNRSLEQLNSLEKLKLHLKMYVLSLTKQKRIFLIFRPSSRKGAEVQEEPTLIDDECLSKLALNLNKHSKTLKTFSFALEEQICDNALLRFTSKGYGKIGEGLLDCLNIENLALIYLQFDYLIRFDILICK